MANYYVRCKPSSTDPIKTIVCDNSGVPIPDEIHIKSPTTFSLVLDRPNSDDQGTGFTIRIQSNSTDIKILQDDGSNITLVAQYQKFDAAIPLYLYAEKNGIRYHTESGKPVIRNDPRRPAFTPVRIAALLLAGLAILILLYFAFFNGPPAH